MINDEFFTMFFNLTNLVIAQIISVIRLMTGQLYLKDQFEIYSGVKVHEQEKPYVQLYMIFIVFSLLINFFADYLCPVFMLF